MPESIENNPNYWREGLERFSLNQAKYLALEKPNTDWIKQMTEEEAQKMLEILERTQVLIENSFPLD